MLFNVSTLLREPVGSTRSYHIEDEPARVPDEAYATVVSGDVRVLRSVRGVFVSARLAVRSRLECGRCLASFEHDLSLEFDEEFVVEHDLDTGAPVEGIMPDDFRIEGGQHLDLSEAVRQYEQSALPLRPVCRPDCRGLCPACGQDLNEQACGCEREGTDARWAGLATLAERLRTEDDDGRTEA